MAKRRDAPAGCRTFLASVVRLMETHVAVSVSESNLPTLTGQMLRSRFAWRLAAAMGSKRSDVVRAAAAVELFHTASLIHDDVIDGDRVRRGRPALWVTHGLPAAILAGDQLLLHCFDIIGDYPSPNLRRKYSRAFGEICNAEREHESCLGTDLSLDAVMSLARRKTGSLFALLGHAVGQCEVRASKVLTECGYLTGVIYQLLNDWHDETRSEGTPPPGSDARRRKPTFASVCARTGRNLRCQFDELMRDGQELLKSSPSLAAAWMSFWTEDCGVYAAFVGATRTAGGFAPARTSAPNLRTP
jgi:geranylgeranyl pyrophosphate synthase